MKQIVCRPAPELELVSGGVTVLLRFDIFCISELQDLEGGLAGVLSQSTPQMAASIIYAAAKNNNDNFSREDAIKLVSCMDVQSINDIINEFSSSMGVAENEMQKEISKNLMAQFLNQLK